MNYIKLVKQYIQMFPPLDSVLRLICPPHVIRTTLILPSRINLHFSICLCLVDTSIKILSGYAYYLYAYYAYKIINKKLCDTHLLRTKLP
jgi:hypothetical protein